ncbi:MAG TPA: cytochrome d ubiquinol oxidase subunit II [Candidatus Limnocylindrales bacterium]|nr:cytochrome d ubiquinol oxidase subunit II [Candidatus Limnocylindrales bacterium]
MQLADAPVVLMLLGLTAYMVLGGADFGTGIWELTAGSGARGQALRDYAHTAMAPVWEANHVWLIFVLVVFWSAYPVAFGSVMSTLTVPLFLATVGIVLRGSAYALRTVAWGHRERGLIDNLFALSSVLTPFALGASIGGIASGRVPIGNAAGNLLTSWLNPTSIVIGAIAVAAAAHLAAVYLAADATRARQLALVPAFRARALVSGMVTGALALIGLAVLSGDAPHLFAGLRTGPGLAAVVVSGVAGLSTLVLVWAQRYEPARYAGAGAVAAIIAGWAAAQQPDILPGLPVTAAAAGRSTLITILVIVGVGGLIVVPSLALLFSLFLHGRFDPGVEPAPAVAAPAGGPLPRTPAAILIVLLCGGVGLTIFTDGGWPLWLGIVALLVFVLVGFFVFTTAIAGTADRRS